uniref:gametocyte-specific factor 1-like n=1 Tax=Myxine glutinosa TaxID=7769 RepID=UPI00358ECBA2
MGGRAVLPTMACMDPDEIFTCPYDQSHLVRASRFPYHIVKCKKNNLHLAKRMNSCPFNARHIILKTEMESHIMQCPDKITIAQDVEQCRSSSFQLPLPQYIESDNKPLEDWENEIDESASKHFIWGRTGGAVCTMPRHEKTQPSSKEDQKLCTVREQARGHAPPSMGSGAKDGTQGISTKKPKSNKKNI